MKFAVWAEQNGISYQTAWNWFTAGKLFVPAIQTACGTILVKEAVERERSTVIYPRVYSTYTVFMVSESCYRYEPKQDPENALIADSLIRLTDNHRNWGFGLCVLYLRNVKSFGWNHKCVYRLYRELELNCASGPRSAWCERSPNFWRRHRPSIRYGRWTSCTTG